MISTRALAFDLGLDLLGEARITFDVQELINGPGGAPAMLRAALWTKSALHGSIITVSPSGNSLPFHFITALPPHAQDAVVLDAHFILDLLGERLWRRLVLAGAAAHFFGWLRLPFAAGLQRAAAFELAAQIIAMKRLERR